MEIPRVELPEYAKHGKRLPAHGAAPGRAVITYCHTFEIDKDAASYFKTLTRIRRLPTTKEVVRIAARSLVRCIPDSPHCARRCR